MLSRYGASKFRTVWSERVWERSMLTNYTHILETLVRNLNKPQIIHGNLAIVCYWNQFAYFPRFFCAWCYCMYCLKNSRHYLPHSCGVLETSSSPVQLQVIWENKLKINILKPPRNLPPSSFLYQSLGCIINKNTVFKPLTTLTEILRWIKCQNVFQGPTCNQNWKVGNKLSMPFIILHTINIKP